MRPKPTSVSCSRCVHLARRPQRPRQFLERERVTGFCQRGRGGSRATTTAHGFGHRLLLLLLREWLWGTSEAAGRAARGCSLGAHSWELWPATCQTDMLLHPSPKTSSILQPSLQIADKPQTARSALYEFSMSVGRNRATCDRVHSLTSCTDMALHRRPSAAPSAQA